MRHKKGQRERGASHTADGPELYKKLMSVALDDDGLEDAPPEALDAVIHVFCTHSPPRWGMPWQRQRQYSSASSGLVIQGRRLLTNAHSVEFATVLSVCRRGDDRKFIARCVAVCTECDLALLTVDDDAFWEGPSAPKPLRFGRLPRLQDAVAVLGYPVGGDTLSITAGVVSRIEGTEYVHGATQLLACTVDAAINAGNSGGPVLNEAGLCVGVAFQSLGGDAENVGYCIPTPVVAHFLADVERNGGANCTGFPCLSFEWQPCESPALRASLGLDRTAGGGVLITRVEPTSPMAAALRRGDVLTAFDGVAIAADGSVPFRTGERISFDHLITQRFIGDVSTLGVVRDKASLSVEVTLGTHAVLVPPFVNTAQPPWLIAGGCVFVAGSEPYLKGEFGEEWEYEAPVPMLHTVFMELAQSADEQCVVLAQILAARCNVGFDDASVAHCRVLAFNGTRVTSLAHLASLLAACSDPFYKLDLDGGQTVLLDAEQCRAEASGILAAHGVPSPASPDLMPLLMGKTV